MKDFITEYDMRGEWAKDEFKLKNWEKVTQDLSMYFVAHYYGSPSRDNVWWVGEVGEVLCVNDDYFDLSDMCKFIRCKYSKKMMSAYLEYRLDALLNNKCYVNIENYKKGVRIKDKKSKSEVRREEVMKGKK